MLTRSKLRCSFCGKSEKDVAKLMGGAHGGYICGVCVGVCNRILEATPQTFAGWDTMSDEQLVSALQPASATVDATRAVLHSIPSSTRYARAASAGRRSAAGSAPPARRHGSGFHDGPTLGNADRRWASG
jgi:hypothetical protein